MTTTRLKSLLLAICVGGSASLAAAQSIDPIVEVGKQRAVAAKSSQAKIDRLADEAASLLSDYKTVMKQVDGLKVYNARLERQIANQEKRIFYGWSSSVSSSLEVHGCVLTRGKSGVSVVCWRSKRLLLDSSPLFVTG